MRIISGTARSVKLKPIPGLDVRPTGDRVKESLFNIIQFDIEGRNALDLFAGTGQIGIEALSRGARNVVFVDNFEKAVKTISENLESTKLAENAQVEFSDYKAFIKRTHKEKFDLIFLDPPYNRKLVQKALNYVETYDIINIGGIVICETEVSEVLEESYGKLKKQKEYIYGSVKITKFEKCADSDE